MRKQIATWAIFVALGLATPAVAQEPDSNQATILLVGNSPEQTSLMWQGIAKPRDVVLTDIVNWLAAIVGLPAIYDHPQIQFVSSENLVGMRYNAYFGSGRPASGSQPIDVQQNEIVAVYSDAMKIIFLHEGWTGKTPAEQSVLVHEMVHHLQNLGHLKYECSAAREKIAYDAQNRWLALFGQNLDTEFQLDPFTRLARSICIY